jgi:hypothetical protein
MPDLIAREYLSLNTVQLSLSVLRCRYGANRVGEAGL